MARKIITKEIEYYDKKKKDFKLVKFKISIIPQIVVLGFEDLYKQIEKVSTKANDLAFITDEIGSAMLDANIKIKELKLAKKDDYKSDIKELKSSLKKAVDIFNAKKKAIDSELKSFDVDTFMDERIRLIKIVLEENGIEDEYYHSREFWEKKVDASVANNFLEDLVYKDIKTDKKKKTFQKVKRSR